MLASHNILNPANGAPIAVPSQDMVLGLYYITKSKRSTKEETVKGEDMTFYSAEEVTIAYNEKRADLHAVIKVRIPKLGAENGETELIETTVGRVLFNEFVPEEIGFWQGLCNNRSIRILLRSYSMPEHSCSLRLVTSFVFIAWAAPWDCGGMITSFNRAVSTSSR